MELDGSCFETTSYKRYFGYNVGNLNMDFRYYLTNSVNFLKCGNSIMFMKKNVLFLGDPC